MLFKNFLSLAIGIMVGIWIAKIASAMTVFIPNIKEYEALIVIGAGILLYLCLDKFEIGDRICLGIMGILIIDLLGGFTFLAISCGTIITIILYASIGLLKVTLAFYPQHKLE